MKIKVLDFGYKTKPMRAHFNDAGADVFTACQTILPKHSTVKIPLGFGLEIPDGYAAFIFPRSGWAAKGITCELPPIDSGYRGEVHAIVTNHLNRDVTIPSETKIGQLVVLPVIIAEFVESLGPERSDGAFGSTGN